MSLRPNAPYRDQVEQDGTVLIYEGHDQPNRAGQPNPKTVDQPATFPSGGLTENGKFHEAALAHRNGEKLPDVVRVYEKLKQEI
jgi:deoxyribose-phosphate aldolase